MHNIFLVFICHQCDFSFINSVRGYYQSEIFFLPAGDFDQKISRLIISVENS